jgi:hypothetical protein
LAEKSVTPATVPVLALRGLKSDHFSEFRHSDEARASFAPCGDRACNKVLYPRENPLRMQM